MVRQEIGTRASDECVVSGVFEVDLSALAEFHRVSGRHAAILDQAGQTLGNAEVGRESFGIMPGSSSIFGDYEQRVQSGLDSLKDCAEALRVLGALVSQCGDEYRGIDTTLQREFGQIESDPERGFG